MIHHTMRMRGPSPLLHINKRQFGHLLGFFPSPWRPPSAFTLSITLQPCSHTPSAPPSQNKLSQSTLALPYLSPNMSLKIRCLLSCVTSWPLNFDFNVLKCETGLFFPFWNLLVTVSGVTWKPYFTHSVCLQHCQQNNSTLKQKNKRFLVRER